MEWEKFRKGEISKIGHQETGNRQEIIERVQLIPSHPNQKMLKQKKIKRGFHDLWHRGDFNFLTSVLPKHLCSSSDTSWDSSTDHEIMLPSKISGRSPTRMQNR